MRWWSWAAGRQSRQAVVRKWLTEDFGSNAPLLVAASAGPALGVAFMAYNLLYNTTVFINKDDRMADLPEDPHLGAAFQQHGLRQYLRRHYYPHGPDSVAPYLLPFKRMNLLMASPPGDAKLTPATQAGIADHVHTVAEMSEDAWRSFLASGRRHWRLFRQPNVDPENSLVRDTRPIVEQLLHKGTPDEHQHLHDPDLIYHPKPVHVADTAH